MTLTNLNSFLFKETPSERKHKKEGPNVLSKKYALIQQKIYKGKRVYNFSYDSILGPTNIAINKESRWTFVPNHIHTVIEMIYVYSGSCTQTIEGRKIKMNEGDLCLLDQNVLHSIGYLGKSDIVISIVMRKEYFSQGILTQLSQHSTISTFLANAISKTTAHNKFLLFKNINQVARNSINSILKEYFNKSLCSDQIINAHIILLMSELMRQFKNIQQERTPLINEDILDYIDKNFEQLTLKSLSEHFGYHPNYLSELIHKETGQTFKNLIINKKFEKICFLLVSSNQPIYQIAQEEGYNNLGFFYKKFKEKYGISPLEYRKRKGIL